MLPQWLLLEEVIGNKDLTQISQQVQGWDRERKEKSHN